LFNTTILLLNLGGWKIEELEMNTINSVTSSGSLVCSTSECHVSVILSEINKIETKVSIAADGENQESIATGIDMIKKCFAFALDEGNKEKLKDAHQRVKEEIEHLALNIINKKLFKESKDSIDAVEAGLAEIEKRYRDPYFHYSQAIDSLKQLVPDIEQTESHYWEEIQPLPTYTDDLLKGAGAEEELNLALGIGLRDLDAAKAKFILITILLTKKVVEGIIKWDDTQNLPLLRPLAREIVEFTKKHLRRDHQNLEALRLQRAAYYYLQNWEGVGAIDHSIAKIRSLIKVGLLSENIEDSATQLTESERNDGKNLEEKVQRLLQSMGLKSFTTKATGDGGIDIVAYSESPIFSGKYIVQCKDWGGSVGEPTIRDLYGVVMAESANKGILITTGTITKSAYKFADGKPIELIDGQQLNNLLQKYKTE
jgi:HJR/Mrr/RecB family endonuclease